jgi:hypothetical protein
VDVGLLVSYARPHRLIAGQGGHPQLRTVSGSGEWVHLRPDDATLCLEPVAIDEVVARGVPGAGHLHVGGDAAEA